MKFKDAHSEAPKVCMHCGAKTKKPTIKSVDYTISIDIWPNSLLNRLGKAWIVECTKCPSIHVWSYPNVYKLYVDPMKNIILGEN